jgi:hypothetical protein
MQNLSSEAYFVLSKMLTGAVLVGAISEHGRPFRLGLPGAEAWEEVPHRVVKELLARSSDLKPTRSLPTGDPLVAYNRKNKNCGSTAESNLDIAIGV